MYSRVCPRKSKLRGWSVYVSNNVTDGHTHSKVCVVERFFCICLHRGSSSTVGVCGRCLRSCPLEKNNRVTKITYFRPSDFLRRRDFSFRARLLQLWAPSRPHFSLATRSGFLAPKPRPIAMILGDSRPLSTNFLKSSSMHVGMPDVQMSNILPHSASLRSKSILLLTITSVAKQWVESGWKDPPFTAQ